MTRPRVEETTRPWRLWDTKRKGQVRWRYFKTRRRAEESALIEVGWSEVGTTIEVYNCVTHRVPKSFTMHPNGMLHIEKGPHHGVE